MRETKLFRPSLDRLGILALTAREGNGSLSRKPPPEEQWFPRFNGHRWGVIDRASAMPPAGHVRGGQAGSSTVG